MVAAEAEDLPTAGEPEPLPDGKQSTMSVDPHKLADKVYQLMLVEIRHARARGEPAHRPREDGGR